MKNLPNPTVPMVDDGGRPSSSLLSIMANLSAIDVVADQDGLPTSLFLNRLRTVSKTPLPNVGAAIVNPDGTPTRVFTALLMGLK